MKSRGGKSQRREEKKKEDQRRERVRRKKMQVREKVEKSRSTVFPMFCGSWGSKSRVAKAAGAEPFGQMRDEKLQAVVARSTHFQSNFGSWDVKNVHFVVAQSTFRSQKCKKTGSLGALFEGTMWKMCAVAAQSICRSQNAQNASMSERFWKLRCRKSACRCGAKHIPKSKCTKHTSSGPLFEVEASKKCTPLWREARVEVKMWKAHTTFGPLLDVELRHTTWQLLQQQQQQQHRRRLRLRLRLRLLQLQLQLKLLQLQLQLQHYNYG